MSLSQAATAGLSNQAVGYLQCSSVPQRSGSDHPSIVPYGTLFEDKNGKLIVLAIGTDSQFEALSTTLGIVELSKTYTTNHVRVKNRQIVKDKIAEKILKWDRDELLKQLWSRAIPAGPVGTFII